MEVQGLKGDEAKEKGGHFFHFLFFSLSFPDCVFLFVLPDNVFHLFLFSFQLPFSFFPLPPALVLSF